VGGVSYAKNAKVTVSESVGNAGTDRKGPFRGSCDNCGARSHWFNSVTAAKRWAAQHRVEHRDAPLPGEQDLWGNLVGEAVA